LGRGAEGQRGRGAGELLSRGAKVFNSKLTKLSLTQNSKLKTYKTLPNSKLKTQNSKLSHSPLI
jgi:hypothetical protein